MARSAVKNMTTGSPMKHILGFSIPLLFGCWFQQLYSMVDTIIVGQYLGMNALAGVGSTGSINFMIVGFCIGVCNGFAIPIAQRFGAKDYAAMRKFVANCTWLSIIFSAIITVVVASLCKDILIWMKTPSDIYADAYSYIFIIFLGIPATFLYNVLSGIIRSLGDSKTPLVFLIISSLLNIALDLLCIVSFGWGVAGAAIATVASQLISGILCLIYMIKKFDIFHIQKEEWKIDFYYIRLLCGMGIPMGLQYTITAIGAVVLQTAVNSLGSLAVAALAAGNKVSMLFGCCFDALGSTMATYGGQNAGAGKPDRIKKGLKDCVLLGSVYSVLAFTVLYFFGENFAALFVNANEVNATMLSNSRLFLIINSAFYIPLALVNIVRFLIQGMGHSPLAIIAGVLEMVARIIVATILVPLLGFSGVCLASPLAWIMADAFLIPAYIHVQKKLEKSLA